MEGSQIGRALVALWKFDPRGCHRISRHRAARSDQNDDPPISADPGQPCARRFAGRKVRRRRGIAAGLKPADVMAQTNDASHSSRTRTCSCRAEIQMSGFSQLEMSGSRQRVEPGGRHRLEQTPECRAQPDPAGPTSARRRAARPLEAELAAERTDPCRPSPCRCTGSERRDGVIGVRPPGG